MRRHIAHLALASLFVVVFAATASAQMLITHEMRPLCDELPQQGMIRTHCNEYYEAKQEVMNTVIADCIAAVSTNPGDDGLLTKVAGDVLELHNELHVLMKHMDELMGGGDFTEDLHAAINNEVEAIDLAGEYWGLMTYLASMSFQDVLTMLDAVDDFDAKAEELKGIAEELAEHYQEALNVTDENVDYSLEIIDNVRADFATDVFMAKTLAYSTENLSKDLNKVLETLDPETRFSAELEFVSTLREQLDEDWYSMHDHLMAAGEELDTMRDDALYMLEERKTIMDEETLYDEFGQPFEDIMFEDIVFTYEEMYAVLKEMLDYLN